MKNFILYFIPIAIILSIFSCRHDPENIVPDTSLVLELIAGENFVSTDITLPVNYHFSVCIYASVTGSNTEKINNLVVYRIEQTDTVTESDTLFDSNGKSVILEFKTASAKKTETWIFKAFDYQGNFTEKQIQVSTDTFPPSMTCLFEKNFVQINGEINIAIEAEANTTTKFLLENLKIKRTFNNVTETVLDTSFLLSSFIIFQEFNAQPDEGSELWEVTLTDTSGFKSVYTYNIYSVVLMSEEHYGTIWNPMGTNNYAWDLDNNSQLYFIDSDNYKDMSNHSDSAYSLPPFYFDNSWTAMNTTLFKRANQLDYDNVSLLEAIDAYTGGSMIVVPSSSATGLQMGDIYVAKLRSSENYAVIQILSVDQTNGNNQDKIEFRYKK